MKRYIKSATVIKDKYETVSILQSIANKPLWIHVYIKNYNGGKKDECWIRVHYADTTELGSDCARVSFWEFVGNMAFAEGRDSVIETYAHPYHRTSNMIQIIEPVTIISQEELRQKYIEDNGYGEE